MDVRRTFTDPARAGRSAPDSSSSTTVTATRPAVRLRGVALAALPDAPACVQAMTKGVLPKTAADFNTCVGWLAQRAQKEGLQDLLSAPECRKFDKLDLHGQAMSPEALECLVFHLDESCITAVNLSGCHVNQAHANTIGTMLAPGSKLTLVHLGHNHLGAAGMAQMCQSLRANKTLEHLNLSHCGFAADHFCDLLRVLSQTRTGRDHPMVPAPNQTLASLCFAGNHLFADDTYDMSSTPPVREVGWPNFKFVGLGDMPGIQWLDLSDTNILLSFGAASSLFAGFNPALARLDLSDNEFFDDTLKHLERLESITHLVLTNMQHALGTEGRAEPIGLLCLSNLKVLDLRGVPGALATRGTAKAAAQDERIKQHLAENPSLVCVKLDAAYADHPLILETNLAPFKPERLGFSVLAGAAGKFLASVPDMNGVEIADDGAVAFAAELDLLSTMHLMSVNTTLARSRPASLQAGSGDPGFDWDLVWRVDGAGSTTGNTSNANPG
jgi:hypothetical protein